MILEDQTRRELLRGLESYTELTLFIASAKAAGVTDAGELFAVDEMSCRAKDIREFVTALPNCKEKLLLYFRYIRGMSMEKTAELLGISPRSAYRMRQRALDFAEKKYRGEFSPND
ncbi:MAG: sigma-70 family RNA polymerase sigma factor [Ruminococcaceae bacterium]|nr:sigma-70 family RNA polymerase sigma factor [Oscillospiraceae bacterium]